MSTSLSMSGPPTVADQPEAARIANARPGGCLAPGTELGRYLVLEELGRGGLGVVVSAYDPELRRQVAIKVLHRSTEPEQLLREARALAALNHPNVVAIHDFGPHEAGTFIAMEYVDGETLATWLRARDRSLDAAAIIEVFVAAARGLHAAHEAGITHRDFKPSNVMVGRDGRVRVTDFGLAHGQALAPDDLIEGSVLTTISHPSGLVVGTPAYMAPEQFGPGEVDQRADQFAFCVALWEALCAQRPFPGRRYAELRVTVCEGQPRPPPASAHLPSWLRRALERGLARDPAARHPSMLELIEALESDPRPRRRRRAVFIGVVALLGLGLGLDELEQRGARQACALEAQEASTLVDRALTEELAGAFDATGLPFATSSYVRVSTQLREWASAWSQARTELCTALVEGELSETEVAPRLACLDEQLERGGSFIALLDSPTPDIVRAAVPAAAKLSAASRCAQPQALLVDASALESLDLSRSALDRELSRISSLLTAEQNDAARKGAAALLVEAQTHARAPTLVPRIQLALGQALIALGEHDAGHEALRAAYYAALEASTDVDALDAAIALIDANAQLHANYELATRWAETAEALTTRLGLERSAVDGERLAALGNLHYHQNHHEPAAEAYEAAHAINLERLPAGHPQIAGSLINLANIAAARDQPERARERYLEAHALLASSYGERHPGTARPLLNLGNLELDRGNFDAAIELYERAHALLEPLGDDSYELTVVLQNLGGAWFYTGQTEQACAAWESVLAIHRRQLPGDSPEIAEMLVNVGTCRNSLGEPDTAIAALEESLDILATNFGPEDPRLAPIYNNLGVILRSMGRLDQALEVSSRGLAIHQSQNEDSRAVAQTRMGLAKIQLERGDLAAARVFVDAALAYYAREPGPGLGEASSRCVDLALRRQAGAEAEALAEVERLLADPAWTDNLHLHQCLVEYDLISPRPPAPHPPPP